MAEDQAFTLTAEMVRRTVDEEFRHWADDYAALLGEVTVRETMLFGKPYRWVRDRRFGSLGPLRLKAA